MDVSAQNEFRLTQSEEMWEALMEMFWWLPDEEADKRLVEQREQEARAEKAKKKNK